MAALAGVGPAALIARTGRTKRPVWLGQPHGIPVTGAASRSCQFGQVRAGRRGPRRLAPSRSRSKTHLPRPRSVERAKVPCAPGQPVIASPLAVTGTLQGVFSCR